MANPVKVEINGDASGLMDALGKSTAGLKGFARDVDGVGNSLTSMLKNVQAPFVALAALVGGGAFLKGAVTETVDWTVQAQKLARTLGITTEAASVFGVAIKNVHGDGDTFLAIAAKMTRTLNTNESAFTKLGVATRDSGGHLRNSQDILMDTFEALEKVKGGTDRNVASTQIFGRNFLEVAKYLGITREALDKAREEAVKLNLIVGADSVAASNRYRKSSEDLDLTLKGLKIRLGQELLPVMTQFNEAAAEDGPTAISILGNCLKGITELIDGAWSGFKMFAIGLVGVVNAIAGTIMTILGTAWGFLKAGIPGAKAAFKEGNDSLKEDWAATIAALDEVGVAYMQRQGQRWEGWGNGKGKSLGAPAPDGNHADTKEHKDKENVSAAEMRKLRAEALEIQLKDTLAAKEANETAKAGLDLEEQQARYKKEVAAGTMTEAQGVTARVEAERQYVDKCIAINDKYAAEKVKINADTLAKLDILESAGIQKQIAEKRKEFAAINAERHKAGLEAIADSELQEQIAILKSREMLKSKDSSKWSGTDGMISALGEFSKKSSNVFETWKGAVTGVLQGVQSSFATAFKGILSGQMSFSQGLKSLWKGIADSVVSALANIAAQYLTNAAAQAIFGAATATTSATTTSATTSQAAAETWAAYAPFPYIGEALALAQIGIMTASISAAGLAPVVAHARGGLIDRPTLALMGEVPGSREIVAPETMFQDWAGNLTANIVAGERRSQAYQAQGGSYATQAAAHGSPDGYGTVHVNLSGAIIAGESVESARIIGNLVKKHLDSYGRRNG